MAKFYLDMGAKENDLPREFGAWSVAEAIPYACRLVGPTATSGKMVRDGKGVSVPIFATADHRFRPVAYLTGK